MTNAARYLGLIIATFPELRSALEEEDDGIYSKTHVFTNAINAAIVRGDWDMVQRAYELMDRILREDPSDEVYNVVYVSFVEHLDFTDPKNGEAAKRLLTPRLLQAWHELEEYWRKLHEERKRETGRQPRPS